MGFGALSLRRRAVSWPHEKRRAPEYFRRYRHRGAPTDASIADTIAHQLIRSIEDKWDEDPIFFEKFAKLIQPTIADFHKGRAPPVAVTVRYCGCISVAHLRAQAARQLPDQSTTLRVACNAASSVRLDMFGRGWSLAEELRKLLGFVRALAPPSKEADRGKQKAK